jgi:16S rRNA (uracil1498-N3)-methyltransferase
MPLDRTTGKHREGHHLFFAPDLAGTAVDLDETETVHAVSVLRLKPGDALRLTDGNGVRAAGIYESAQRHSLRVRITERTAVERQVPHLRLYVGLPDRDAFEALLPDATALGAERIVPVIAEHCRKPWWDGGWEKHLHRFRQKMIVALKQSDADFLPILEPPCTLVTALHQASGTLLVADQNGVPLNRLPQFERGSTLCCFIGPPGGFSDEELRSFDARPCSRIRIAMARLRTELATTVLCALVAGQLL